jgi:alkylation response protein AidB-like acyl-CoA dehydrogenase
MRAGVPLANVARLTRQIALAPGRDRLATLIEDPSMAAPEMVEAVLESAARFANDVLVPLNDTMDTIGCKLVDGRVVTAPGHSVAWAEYLAAGWPTIEAAPQVGGQGMPLALTFAVQAVFDRACPAFGMLPVPQRSAAKLIQAYGDDETCAEWLVELANGRRGATICVSEADAGSDLRRIRTRAAQDGDGVWRVTGEKCWISFADHDLTEQIGHCVLALAPTLDGREGSALFLVPSQLPNGTRNGVFVRRIEHKMGLHGSPTCVLGFENAEARLLGEPGRGLAQLFVMIVNMRLAVGAMGIGIADGCTDVARSYAAERRQGGSPAPLPIHDHADVQRQLLEMAAETEALRGLLFATANFADLGSRAETEAERRKAQALAQWLLPIVKTLGGEIAFRTASNAVQVLGGAGYTREWPVEQALRDARVLTVFEGTTGMQALDLARRRLLSEGEFGLAAFLEEARADAAMEPSLAFVLRELEGAAQWLRDDPDAVGGGAVGFLEVAGRAALTWIAARLTGVQDDDLASAYLRNVGEHYLQVLAPGTPTARMRVHPFDLARRFAAIRVE